jgi:predicted nucleic acid-binding protein|nr:hypothetical protein [Pseudanabaena cinerea]
MTIVSSFSIVIDTNVLFEGLTKQGGAAGLIIDAWLARLLEVSRLTSSEMSIASSGILRISSRRF